jgi:CRISPR-associated endoribonuclease Cas6
MEHVDVEYAAQLHRAPFNPYSQYCFWNKDGGVLVWRINALTDDAAKHIIEPIQSLDAVRIRSLGTEFKVHTIASETVELKELTDMIHGSTQTRSTVRFLTPTAFKSSGAYVFMPTPRLIFQNLMMHYSQVYEGDNEVSPDTIDYLDKHTGITAYNLRSQYFDHATAAGKKIPAFVGTMALTAKGPQALTGLAHMLLKFGEYAGIGIKTSMGMGGMMCLPKEARTSTPTVERK